jgi:hypothetical protein
VQAVLTYLYDRALNDGQHPANDLKLLGKLRNGVVDYKFRDERLTSALTDLAQRGYLNAPPEGWDQVSVTWATYAKPEHATWAYETACDAALAIAALMPSDDVHQNEVEIIRLNFEKKPVNPPANSAEKLAEG